MSKKILIIASNVSAIGPQRRRTGNYSPEVAHPCAYFDRAKYQIGFATLTGEAPFLDALHLADDPDNLSFLVGKGWAAMLKAPQLADVDVSRYDAIFVPGGLAPMVDMPEHPLLKQVLGSTYERSAVVGAVCHGPVSLLNVRLSSGAYLLDGKTSARSRTTKKRTTRRPTCPLNWKRRSSYRARSSTKRRLGSRTALPTGILSPARILLRPKALPKR